MELTRKQVIEILENAYARQYNGNTTSVAWSSKLCNAVYYAISSLKTDEAYQLMYEGVEVYDKDTVAWMFRELQLEIEELDSRTGYSGDGMPTFSTYYIRKKKVNELVQQKINALRGNENGTDE